MIEQLTAERQEEILKSESKSWLKLFSYLLVGYFPVFLGIYGYIAVPLSSEELIIPKQPKLIQYFIPIFLVLVIIESFVELFKKEKYYRLNDTFSSISMGVYSTIFSILFHLGNFEMYVYINKYYSLIDFARKQSDYNWFEWMMLFFMVEFSYYWFHRFGHEWNIGWAGHIVHHTSEEYNLSTALRQSYFQPFFSQVFFLPFAFIAPVPLFYYHKDINTIYQFFIHTRHISKLWWPIEFIFNTPSHHRVHHGRNWKYVDKNYGGTLIIFDRMFGSFQEEEEAVNYGISTKIASWNPFFLQHHYWMDIYEASQRSNGILNKIRCWLDYSPIYSWKVNKYAQYQKFKDRLNSTPKIEEKKEEIKKPIKKRQKYDSNPVNQQMWFYSFLHFILEVVISFSILNSFPKFNLYQRMLSGCYVYFHMYSLSTIFDQKSFSTFLEISRLSLSMFVIYQFNSPKFFYGNALINAISIGWLLIFNKKVTSLDEHKKLQ
eukprot:gene2164-2029_t